MEGELVKDETSKGSSLKALTIAERLNDAQCNILQAQDAARRICSKLFGEGSDDDDDPRPASCDDVESRAAALTRESSSLRMLLVNIVDRI